MWEKIPGTLDVKTDATGNASFTFHSPVLVPAGQFITALATRLEARSLAPIQTSEFSAVVRVTGKPGQANVAVSQVASPKPARVGKDLVFTLTVANAGPSLATGVRLVVTPPPGATFVRATDRRHPRQGRPDLPHRLPRQAHPPKWSSSSGPKARGALISKAKVSVNEADPSTANNSTSTTVTVARRPRPATPSGRAVVALRRFGGCSYPCRWAYSANA